VCVYMCTCVCSCVCACVCVCGRVCMCLCVCMSVCMSVISLTCTIKIIYRMDPVICTLILVVTVINPYGFKLECLSLKVTSTLA
jgi:hypothetical protein